MKNMRKEMYVVALLTALLLMPLVAASNPMGATTTSGPTETSVGADDGASDGVEGGYIYTTNLNASSQTSLWTGYLGNVTGKIQLRGSSNKSMFDWSVGAVRNQTALSYYSMIFAYNSTTVPVWSAGIAVLSGGNLDTRFGLETTLSDSGTNTFTSTSTSVKMGNQTVNGVASSAAKTIAYRDAGSTGIQTALYETQAWSDGTANVLFASIMLPIQANLTAYSNAAQVNYQMLLFSNNKGTTSGVTYDFYLQLA
ncbi:hypothetical protein HZC09_06120 [Candidatus Micrarchaeota archaeon]|nr:hypothetical protein [Candidatus Micrarchaeota archaeon]